MDFGLTDSEKIILLDTARKVIASNLGVKINQYKNPTATLLKACGAFVTLHKKGMLKGCIGYVVAVNPLIETVKEVSLSSAFKDPRFPPVKEDELKDIELEISVLSPLRKINNIEEIQVGKHGIMIKRGFASGLLLPQVATDHNWNRETFLTHTCYKAGLAGDCWKMADTQIQVFSAIIFDEKEMGLI